MLVRFDGVFISVFGLDGWCGVVGGGVVVLGVVDGVGLMGVDGVVVGVFVVGIVVVCNVG